MTVPLGNEGADRAGKAATSGKTATGAAIRPISNWRLETFMSLVLYRASLNGKVATEVTIKPISNLRLVLYSDDHVDELKIKVGEVVGMTMLPTT